MKTGFIMTALLLAPCVARADPPNSVFVGARLYLSTTTYETDRLYFSTTEHGITRTRGKREKGFEVLPGLVLDGYLRRSSDDPAPLEISTNTKPSDLGEIRFHLESDLVEINHPSKAIVSTGHIGAYFIPAALVKKVVPYKGRFNGVTGYGTGFFVPANHAALMEKSAPLYRCMPAYAELQNEYWLSYDPKVGEKELGPICALMRLPEPSEIDPLLGSGKVFHVSYPAD